MVWAISISLAATLEITIVFSSSGYLDVSVHRVCFVHLCIQCTMTGLQPAGLPHSEIFGSTVPCTSPKLIAAYHVLHRLSMPRHPPYALPYLSSAILHRPSLRLFKTLSWNSLLTRYIYAYKNHMRYGTILSQRTIS